MMTYSSIRVYAQDEGVSFERDYVKEVFDSSNGLDGSAANCIFASEDGLLWIGGYAGLFQYDGIEFKRKDMDGHALSVKTVIQDGEGNLWIGTNGDGIYCYDGSRFRVCKVDSEENRALFINQFTLDSEGNLWVGTKAGLFYVDLSEKDRVAEAVDDLGDKEIRDLSLLSTGSLIIITKLGETYQMTEGIVHPLAIEEYCNGHQVRCCSVGSGKGYYLGTDGNMILKMSDSGGVLETIDSGTLSSINAICGFDEEYLWICSDSGIGLLKEDQVVVQDSPMDDSIEGMCKDYQGGYWFASSRQGILHVYENSFSDLGAYLHLDQTINTIQPYLGRLYVGCDKGLYCYRDGEALEDDELVLACQGQRIRQLYVDSRQNLWVSTYQNGIFRWKQESGELVQYCMNNSGLTTDQIRCIYEKKDGEMLVGTEKGVFLICKDDTIVRPVEDDSFNERRILDVKEGQNGKLYAATDSDGIYVIENGEICDYYSDQNGLPSNSVMKIVPSIEKEGLWAVTGAAICFIDEQGKMKNVTAIPYVNCLDLVISKQGEAVILAGNGLFRLKEEDMLKEDKIFYEYKNRQMGLPIDFTANAWNTLQNGTLYLCGVDGAASMNMETEKTRKDIRLYVNSFKADGKEVYTPGKKLVLSADIQRINIDVRILQYIRQNIIVTYFLEGVDQEEGVLEDCKDTKVSYTNLEGGDYVYHLKVEDDNTKECLAEITIPFSKKYHFWELSEVRIIFLILVLLLIGIVVLLIMSGRERKIRRRCELQYLQEKNEEISRLAYKDLVTGVYNRNLFEEERDKINMDRLGVLVLASVNHSDYLKRKYGVPNVDSILRRAVQTIKDYNTEEIKIYRVSDYTFCFWLTELVDLEPYVRGLKMAFEISDDREKAEVSMAVGAVYHDKVKKESFDELLGRCEKMRLLDEKHAEFSFVEGKVKQL